MCFSQLYARDLPNSVMDQICRSSASGFIGGRRGLSAAVVCFGARKATDPGAFINTVFVGGPPVRIS